MNFKKIVFVIKSQKIMFNSVNKKHLWEVFFKIVFDVFKNKIMFGN